MSETFCRWTFFEALDLSNVFVDWIIHLLNKESIFQSPRIDPAWLSNVTVLSLPLGCLTESIKVCLSRYDFFVCCSNHFYFHPGLKIARFMSLENWHFSWSLPSDFPVLKLLFRYAKAPERECLETEKRKRGKKKGKRRKLKGAILLRKTSSLRLLRAFATCLMEGNSWWICAASLIGCLTISWWHFVILKLFWWLVRHHHSYTAGIEKA